MNGCAAFHHPRKSPASAAKAAAPVPPAKPAPRRVGTVAVVHEGFVLVDVGTLYAPEAGTALKCMSGGEETAVLTVSPERRAPFITADIVKGTPHRGDEAFE